MLKRIGEIFNEINYQLENTNQNSSYLPWYIIKLRRCVNASIAKPELSYAVEGFYNPPK